jgi:hypothetical protein
MMQRQGWAAVLLGLVVLSVTAVRAQDVTGRWTATFNTQVGEQQYTYDFVMKGTTLTGTAKGSLTGEAPITEGTIEGGKLAFVENAKYQGMDLRITYTGTVASAGEIRLTRTVIEGVTEEAVAKRAK